MDSNIDLSLIYLSLFASGIWIFNRGFLIVEDRNLYQEFLVWLETKPILVPVITFFFSPALILYIESRKETTKYFVSPIISVSIFILGQYLSRRNREQEIKKDERNQEITKRKNEQYKVTIVNNILKLNAVNLDRQISILKKMFVEINNHENTKSINESFPKLQNIHTQFSELDVIFLMEEDILKPIQILQLQEHISQNIMEYNALLEDRMQHILEYKNLSKDSLRSTSDHKSQMSEKMKLKLSALDKLQVINSIEKKIYKKGGKLINTIQSYLNP